MSQKENRRFKKGDLFLYFILLALVFFAFFVFRPTFSPHSRLVVKTPFKEFWLPMDKEQRLSVEGFLGESIIDIGKEGARIIASPCPGGDCQLGSPIKLRGESRVCLPNGVMILVKKGKAEDVKDEPDALLF